MRLVEPPAAFDRRAAAPGVIVLPKPQLSQSLQESHTHPGITSHHPCRRTALLLPVDGHETELLPIRHVPRLDEPLVKELLAVQRLQGVQAWALCTPLPSSAKV
ncbi:hypothetical protein GCM10010349_78170 [Streptomyces flavofungini]|nr:hypothetical protein GCM10010349_78170 [Streptomyces flavofungini]